MKWVILCLVCLFFNCASAVVSNGSGVIETWDGKKYNFKGAVVSSNDNSIKVTKEIIVKKKDIKIIYIIKEYEDETY